MALAPRVKVPESLLKCAPQPAPPAALKTDTDLTDWMIDLIYAGQDCRSKLGTVATLFQGQPK